MSIGISNNNFFNFCSLLLKEEAYDYLEADTIEQLVKKYSQFINFPIYLWSSKVSLLPWRLWSKSNLNFSVIQTFFCAECC